MFDGDSNGGGNNDKYVGYGGGNGQIDWDKDCGGDNYKRR